MDDGILSSMNLNFIGVALVGTLVIYIVVLVSYRLVFSPLAGFPGPKLAAATGLVEFYYDYFKQGRYIYEIEAMHMKYGQKALKAGWILQGTDPLSGPIVRINPEELSLHDPTFYNEIYCVETTRRTDSISHAGRESDFGGPLDDRKSFISS